jgi:hypothetical protein
MSNEAALIVIMAIWLFSGRGLNLCLLIAAYYVAFLSVDITALSRLFVADTASVYGTYAIQASLDSLMLLCIIYLSSFHHKSTRIYLGYGAIIGTSLLLNGLMLFDQITDLSMFYRAHAIRQDFSIPLDVLFAVLGSAFGGQSHTDSDLRTGYDSNYNRSNSDY